MTRSLPPLGLYIHLPWCQRKCPYCDFNSHEAASIPDAAYVDQLLRDLEAEAGHAGGREISTLFIGGGTPSLFPVNAIERLLHGIAERMPLSDDLEATMEANPGSAEADKFRGFRVAGINRLSIGVQSFHDQQLEALGFLIGDTYIHGGKQYIDIRTVLTSELDSTAVSVRVRDFSELFSRLDAMDARGEDYILVGWYHSHPGYSCFLSSTDVSTQTRMFRQDYQTAIVVDPHKAEVKAFRVRDGREEEMSFSVYST